MLPDDAGQHGHLGADVISRTPGLKPQSLSCCLMFWAMISSCMERSNRSKRSLSSIRELLRNGHLPQVAAKPIVPKFQGRNNGQMGCRRSRSTRGSSRNIVYVSITGWANSVRIRVGPGYDRIAQAAPASCR